MQEIRPDTAIKAIEGPEQTPESTDVVETELSTLSGRRRSQQIVQQQQGENACISTPSIKRRQSQQQQIQEGIYSKKDISVCTEL